MRNISEYSAIGTLYRHRTGWCMTMGEKRWVCVSQKSVADVHWTWRAWMGKILQRLRLDCRLRCRPQGS